jgi:hypothetical protein
VIYLRTRSAVLDPQVLADRGRCHVLLLNQSARLPEALEALDTSRL